MLYDLLLLVGIWMAGTALAMPFAGGEIDGAHPLFRLYLVLLAFAYFHFSWRRSGQTLGMRAWCIRLQSRDASFSNLDSLKRFSAGLASWASLGLGFVWGLFRDDRRTWTDLVSRSDLVVQKHTLSAQQHKTEHDEQQCR